MTRILLTLLTVIVSNLSFAKEQTWQKEDSIRNAYDLGKQLCKANLEKYTPAESKLLLGKIMWYANLQDCTGSLIAALLKEVSDYPLLQSKVLILLSKIESYNDFFSLKNISIITTINDATPKQEELKQLYRKYLKLQKELDESSNILRSKEATYEKALAAISENQDTSNTFQLKVQLSTAEQSKAKAIDQTKKDSEAFFNIKSQILQLLQIIDYTKEFYAVVEEKSFSIQAMLKVQEQVMAKNQMPSPSVSYNYQISGPPQGSFRIPTESEMIDAIAIYIAKRFKQESVMWFFEQINKNSAQNELLREFFPNTIALLKTYESFEIPNMGIQWRYALAKDFVQMPHNVLTSEWIKKRVQNINDFKSFIEGSCSIAEGLMNNQSYNSIISNLYLANNNRQVDETKIEFYDVIDLLNSVNNEFFQQDSTGGRIRLTRYDEYKSLTASELELMISLVDMKYHKLYSKFIKFSKTSFQFSNEVTAESLRLLLGRIEVISSELEVSRKLFFDEIKNQGNNGQEPYENVSYNVLNVWTSVNNLFNVFSNEAINYPIFTQAVKSSQALLTHTKQLFEVYDNISRKNYAGATQVLIFMLDDLVYNDSNGWPIDFSELKEDYNFGPFKDMVKDIQLIIDGNLSNDIDSISKMYGFILKDKVVYLQKESLLATLIFDNDRHSFRLVKRLSGFLNDVALSRDSKELSKAIESYALPVGSYKRKRNAWSSVDLTAMVGPYIGWEDVPQKAQKGMTVYGLSVPIGFSFSRTGKSKYSGYYVDEDYRLNPDRIRVKKGEVFTRSKRTVTFCFSIVDFGAVVSYRLKNQSDVLPQKLRWEQLISPGLHTGIAIPSTPLVFQMGYQHTPLLRKLKNDPNNSQYNANRWYIGLFYDLPLINMWEKKKFIDKLYY